MAAFAVLTSLKHIIDNLQNHPSPPISIDKQQVRSLTKVVTDLQEFLQGYNSHLADGVEPDPLETRIAEAAYAAEDVIEAEIVDRIRIRSTIISKIIGILKFSQSLCKFTCLRDDFYQDLQLVIEEMDLIKKVTMTIHKDSTVVRPQLQRNVGSSASSSSTSFSTRQKNAIVGFDDTLNEVLESLMGSQRGLQVIPISGMAGIGKTTLAQYIFENALVKEHFDIHAWATISQDYNTQQALKELLIQAKGKSSGQSENDLGLELYQHLWNRRYFIILDDMWNIEVWDNIRRHFPNCNDGSRIIVTTRQSNLASHLNNGFKMRFLDEVSSWNLFSKTVFGQESFPLKLEEIGKKIVKNCRGLPLSIVTTGGLLAKSEQTRECWDHIEGNLISTVNLEDDAYCLRILKMSYNHLPVHLKSCFLYMGVFKEDHKISVSTLIKMWVSEGILQPTSEQTLEIVGEENLNNLIERNLVLVHQFGSTGKIKYCTIHDLLRDMCLREAEKERFYRVVPEHSPQGIYSLRRVAIHIGTWMVQVLEALQSMPHARSFLCDDYLDGERDKVALNLKLLRILKTYEKEPNSRNSYLLKDVFHLVNLRYIAIAAKKEVWKFKFPWMSEFPSSLNLLWNLQTLIISYGQCITAPIEIWNVPYLRHVKFNRHICLPDPPTDKVVIMENLQTLYKVRNFKLNLEVVKRIPNIKKLVIYYEVMESNGDDYYLNNLEFLHKLESFRCFSFFQNYFLKKLAFPQSLKKLTLVFNTELELEEMFEKIGSLPLLQKLHVSGGCFRTREWVTVEGQFCKLEFLTLRGCGALEEWISERSHFPLLKEIHLAELLELKEIPSEIGDIPTLQKIILEKCSESTVMSAKEILDEQEDLQGEELPFHVRVITRESRIQLIKVHCTKSTGECAEMEGPHFHDHYVNKDGEDLRKLAGPNFQVIYF